MYTWFNVKLLTSEKKCNTSIITNKNTRCFKTLKKEMLGNILVCIQKNVLEIEKNNSSIKNAKTKKVIMFKTIDKKVIFLISRFKPIKIKVYLKVISMCI
jgi:hypothetical protein